MAKHNIEKWSLGYALLKAYVMVVFRLYYKKIVIRGKENIPADEPIILSPNHQNALMDAFAVHYAIPGQLVFLARSDIFENPVIDKILTFMKILPIYRIRDGYGKLQENEAIINKTTDILRKHKYLVILPEGNHYGERRLRPLKKGICRMSFQAEEKSNFNLGLKIVPVGLDYTSYTKMNHTLFINFGKPVEVSKHIPLYKANPQKANNQLLKDISNQMKQYMIHIEDQSHYKLFDSLREIYKYRMKEQLGLKNLQQPNKFYSDKNIIAVLDKALEDNKAEIDDLQPKVAKFNKILKRLRLRYWVLNHRFYSPLKLLLQFVLLMASAPLFLYGLINNFLPYYLPVLATKKIKDKQFHSSFKNGIAILSFPLFYLIQFLVVSHLFSSFLYGLVYLVSLPLTGYLALHYYIALKKFIARVRYNLLMLSKNKSLSEAISLKNHIISGMNKLVKAYHSENTHVNS